MAKRELFRLQQHLVVRTSNYFRRLGDLASQGSIEPREYIEESFNLWSGVLEEVGDWLKPEPPKPPDDTFYQLAQHRYKMRSERGDFGFKVPVDLFDKCVDDKVIMLSTDGMIRTFDPDSPLRPALTLAPEQNVRVFPTEVTRDSRGDPALKVYAISSIVSPQETYEGVIWGAWKSNPQKRFPVAVVELKIV